MALRSAAARAFAQALTAGRTQVAAGAQQARAMGGGGGHHGHGHADTVTYAGLTLRRRSPLQYAVSKAVGTATWFWVFFMLYNEWDVKTKGLPDIFEAEGLDEEDGDHHH